MRDHTGQYCLTVEQWCNSSVFEIIIEIAIGVSSPNDMQIIEGMKYGYHTNGGGFTPLLFENNMQLSKVAFVQRVKTV